MKVCFNALFHLTKISLNTIYMVQCHQIKGFFYFVCKEIYWMLPFEYRIRYPIEFPKGYKTRPAILEACPDGVRIYDGQGISILEPWRDWSSDMLTSPKHANTILLTDKIHVTCTPVGHLSLRAAVVADLLLGANKGMPDAKATWISAKDLVSREEVELCFFKKTLMLVRLKQARTHVLVLRPEVITSVVLALATDGPGYVSTCFFMEQSTVSYPTRFELATHDAAKTFAGNIVSGTNALRRDNFVKVKTISCEEFMLSGLREKPPSSVFQTSRVLATAGILTTQYVDHDTFSLFSLSIPASSSVTPTQSATSPPLPPPPPPPVLVCKSSDEEKKPVVSKNDTPQTSTGEANAETKQHLSRALSWSDMRQDTLKKGLFGSYLTGLVTLCHYRDVSLLLHQGWVIERTDSDIVRAVPIAHIDKIVLDPSSIRYGSNFRQGFKQFSEGSVEQGADIFLGLKSPTLHGSEQKHTSLSLNASDSQSNPQGSTLELKLYTGESLFYTFYSDDARLCFFLQLLDFMQSLCLPVRIRLYRLHRAIPFGISAIPAKLDYFTAQLHSFVSKITSHDALHIDNVVLTSILEDLAFLTEVHPRTLPYDSKDKTSLACIGKLLVFMGKEGKVQPSEFSLALCIVLDFLILLLQSRTLCRAAVQDYYSPLFSEIIELFNSSRCTPISRCMILTVIRAVLTYQWRVLCEQGSNSYSGFSSVYSISNDLMIPDLSCRSSKPIHREYSEKVSTKAFQSTYLENVEGSEGVELMASSFISKAEISLITGKSPAEIKHAYDTNSLPSTYTQGITFSKSRFEMEKENRADLLTSGGPILKLICQVVSGLHKHCRKEPLILLPICGILDDIILFRSHLGQQWFADSVRKAERGGTPLPHPPGRAELFLALGEGFVDYVSLTLLDCRRISLLSRLFIKQLLFEDVLNEKARTNLADYCLSSGAMLRYIDDVISDVAPLSLREGSLQIIATAYGNNATVRSLVHAVFPMPFLNSISSSQLSSMSLQSYKMSSKSASNLLSGKAYFHLGTAAHLSYVRENGPGYVLTPFPGPLEKWKELLSLLPTKSYSFDIVWDESVRANLSMLIIQELTLLYAEAEKHISSMSRDALEKILVTNKPILGTILSWNVDAFHVDLRGKSLFPLTSFDVQINGYYLSYVLWHYISLKPHEECINGKYFQQELLSTLKLEVKTGSRASAGSGEAIKATNLDTLISSYFSHFILLRDDDRSIRAALLFAITLILINSNSRFTQLMELATETIRLLTIADLGLAGLCLSLLEVAASQLPTKYADAASTGLHYYLASYVLPLLSQNKEKNLCLSVDSNTILAAHTYGSLIHISLRVILGCLQSQAMTDKMGRILIPMPQYKKVLSSRAFLPIFVNILLETQSPDNSSTFMEKERFDLTCYKMDAATVNNGVTSSAEMAVIQKIFIQTCELLTELCKQSSEIAQSMVECGVVHFLLSNTHGLGPNNHVVLLLQELYQACSRTAGEENMVSNIVALCLKSLLPEPLVLLLLSSKRASEAAETFTSYETFKINVVWTHEMRYYLYSKLYSWQQPLRAAISSIDEQHRISYLRFFGEYTRGSWCCVPHIHGMEFSKQTGAPVGCYLYNSFTRMSNQLELPLIASYPCIREIEASLAGGIYTSLLRSICKTATNVDLSKNDLISFLQTLLSISLGDLDALYSYMSEEVTKACEVDSDLKSAYGEDYVHPYSSLPPVLRLETEGLHEMTSLCCVRAIDLLKAGLDGVEEMRTTEKRLRKEMQSATAKMGTTGVTAIGSSSLQHPDLINQSRMSETDLLRKLSILLILLSKALGDGLRVFSACVRTGAFHPSCLIFYQYVTVCLRVSQLGLSDVIMGGNSLLDDGWAGEAFSSACTRALSASLRFLNMQLRLFTTTCADILYASILSASTSSQSPAVLQDGARGIAVCLYTALTALETMECKCRLLKEPTPALDQALGRLVGSLYTPSSILYMDPHVDMDSLISNSTSQSYVQTLTIVCIIHYYLQMITMHIDVLLPPQVMVYIFTGTLLSVDGYADIFAQILKLIRGVSSVLSDHVKRFVHTFGTIYIQALTNGEIEAAKFLAIMKGSYYGPRFAFDADYRDRVLLYFNHLLHRHQTHQDMAHYSWTFEEMLDIAEREFTDIMKYPTRLLVSGYHMNNLLGMMVELNLSSGSTTIDAPLQILSFSSKGSPEKLDTSQHICDVLHILESIYMHGSVSGNANMYSAFYQCVGSLIPLHAILSTAFYVIYTDSHLYTQIQESTRVSLLRILCYLAFTAIENQEQLLLDELALAFLLHVLSIEDPKVFLPVVAPYLPVMLSGALDEGTTGSVTSTYMRHYSENNTMSMLDSFGIHEATTLGTIKQALAQAPWAKELYPRPVLCATALKIVLFVNTDAAASGAIHVHLLRFLLQNASRMTEKSVDDVPLVLLLAMEICGLLLRAQNPVLMGLLPPPLVLSLAEHDHVSFSKILLATEISSPEFYWSSHCTNELISLCSSFLSSFQGDGSELVKSPPTVSCFSIPTLQRAMNNKAYIGGVYLDAYLTACSHDPEGAIAVSNPSIAIKGFCAEVATMLSTFRNARSLDQGSLVFISKCLQALTHLTKAPAEILILLRSVDFSKLLKLLLSNASFSFGIGVDPQATLTMAKSILSLLERITPYLNEETARNYSPDIIVSILGLLLEYYNHMLGGSSGLNIMHEHGGALFTALFHIHTTDLIDTVGIYLTFCLTLLWHSPAGRLRIFRTLFATCVETSAEVYGVRLIYTIALHGKDISLSKSMRRAMIAVLAGFFIQSVDVLTEFRDSMCLEDHGHAWLTLCVNDLEFSIGHGDYDPVKMIATNMQGAFPLPSATIGDVCDMRARAPESISQPPDPEKLHRWIRSGFTEPMKGLLVSIDMEHVVRQIAPISIVRPELKHDYHVRRYCMGYQLSYLRVAEHTTWKEVNERLASLPSCLS